MVAAPDVRLFAVQRVPSPLCATVVIADVRVAQALLAAAVRGGDAARRGGQISPRHAPPRARTCVRSTEQLPRTMVARIIIC